MIQVRRAVEAEVGHSTLVEQHVWPRRPIEPRIGGVIAASLLPQTAPPDGPNSAQRRGLARNQALRCKQRHQPHLRRSGVLRQAPVTLAATRRFVHVVCMWYPPGRGARGNRSAQGSDIGCQAKVYAPKSSQRARGGLLFWSSASGLWYFFELPTRTSLVRSSSQVTYL